MKYEWKKQEKDLYLPQETPTVITIPKHKFFAIKGKGNPNEADFSERISVLYSLAYAVRMMPKSGFIPNGYFEYTVYPLEGVWEGGNVSDKNSYIYTIMIRQPVFVTGEIVEKAFETVGRKNRIRFLQKRFFAKLRTGYLFKCFTQATMTMNHRALLKCKSLWMITVFPGVTITIGKFI